MSVQQTTDILTSFPNNDHQAKTCSYQPWVWVALAVITTLAAAAAVCYGLTQIPGLSPLLYGFTVSATLGIGLLATAACLLDAVNTKWSTAKKEEIDSKPLDKEEEVDSKSVVREEEVDSKPLDKEEEVDLTSLELDLLNFAAELEKHQTYLNDLESEENQRLLSDQCVDLSGLERKKQRELCASSVIQLNQFLDSEKKFQTQQEAQIETLDESFVNALSKKYEDTFTELEATKELTTQKSEIAKQILKNLEEKAVNSPILKKTRSRVTQDDKPVEVKQEPEINLKLLESALDQLSVILEKMRECLSDIDLSILDEDVSEDELEAVLDDLAYDQIDQDLHLWLEDAIENANKIGNFVNEEKAKEIFEKYDNKISDCEEVTSKANDLLELVRQRNEQLLDSNLETFESHLTEFHKILKPLYEDEDGLLNDEGDVLKGEERQAQRRLIPECLEQINAFFALEGFFQAEQERLLAFFDEDFVEEFLEEHAATFRNQAMLKERANEVKKNAITIQKKLPVFNSPLPIRTRPKSPQQKMDERLDSMAKVLVTCQSMTYNSFKILANDEKRWKQIQDISVELGNYADDEEKSLLCIDRREGLFAQVTSIRWLKNLVNEIEAVRLNDGTDLAVDATGILKTRLEDLNLQIEKLKEKKLIPLCKLFIEEIRKVESEYLSRKAGHSDLLSLQKRNKAKIAGDKGSGEES